LSNVVGIEACDAQIEAWAKSAAGDGVAVSLIDSPSLAEHRPSVQPMVEIVLLDMQPNLGDDAPKKAVLRATLRYLVTVRANQKGDDSLGRHPNENYAREIMQLFSVGLNRMWDGGQAFWKKW